MTAGIYINQCSVTLTGEDLDVKGILFAFDYE
jgi:hypothetical protein